MVREVIEIKSNLKCDVFWSVVQNLANATIRKRVGLKNSKNNKDLKPRLK